LFLSRKLLNQGFLVVKLKSSLRRFYDHHHDLVAHYWMEYLCNKWYVMFVLYSFMTYQRICTKSNTTGATLGAGIDYPSGAPEFTLVFSGVRVAWFLVFCVMFCRSLFVLFHLAIVFPVLRFTASDYPFGIFKLMFVPVASQYLDFQSHMSWFLSFIF